MFSDQQLKRHEELQEQVDYLSFELNKLIKNK